MELLVYFLGREEGEGGGKGGLCTLCTQYFVYPILSFQLSDYSFELCTLTLILNANNRNPMRAARLFSSNNRSLHQKAIDSLKSGPGRIRVWFCVGDPGKATANK